METSPHSIFSSEFASYRPQRDSDVDLIDQLLADLKNLKLKDADLAAIVNIVLQGIEARPRDEDFPSGEVQSREVPGGVDLIQSREGQGQGQVAGKISRRTYHCSECLKVGFLNPGRNKRTHGQKGHGGPQN